MTIETLKRWLCDHYKEHVEEGAINVDSLERALAAQFDGRPNKGLHEFVVNFCCAIQAASIETQNLKGDNYE